MKFKKFLDEALKPSQFRSYVKAWKESGVARRYDEVFGNKDRIYEPFVITEDKKYNPEVYRMVKSVIELYFPEYEISDYNKGLLKNKHTGRIIKIGKLFSKHIEKYKKEHDMFRVNLIYDTLQRFINDTYRTKTHDLLICYSRHAYDIAGMSTDRGWVSCMELERGQYSHYVIHDILEGTVIAYLVDAKDKNIENPKARVLLKPAMERSTGQWILLPDKVYGNAPNGFLEQVTAWADKNFNKNKYGRFIIPSILHADIANYATFKEYPEKEFEELQKKAGGLYISSAEKLIKWLKSDSCFKLMDDYLEEKITNLRIDPEKIYINPNIKLTQDQIVDTYLYGFKKTFHNKIMFQNFHYFWSVFLQIVIFNNEDFGKKFAPLNLFVVCKTMHVNLEHETEEELRKILKKTIEMHSNLFVLNHTTEEQMINDFIKLMRRGKLS